MTMTSSEVANYLRYMALCRTIRGERHSAVAYERAAEAIYEMDLSATTVGALMGLDGIGKKLADVIVGLRDGHLHPTIVKALDTIPFGLVDVTSVPGIGPKTAWKFYQEHGVDSLDALKVASDRGLVPARFSEAIRLSHLGRVRFDRALVKPTVDWVTGTLSEVEGVGKVECVGSWRRGKDTVGDLDFLVQVSSDSSRLGTRDVFLSLGEKLVSGEAKTSIVLLLPGGQNIRADLLLVPENEWGAALQYFTGSKEHNIKLREIATNQRLLLNEKGLWRIEDFSRKEPVCDCSDERNIYAHLGVIYPNPSERDERSLEVV